MEEVPQSAICPLPTQHQTGETPLGWVNRRLCAFILMFPWDSWIDKGWKVQCRGIGVVQKSMSAFWQWRYWSYWSSLKDTTGHNYLTPPLFILEIASSTHGGVKWVHWPMHWFLEQPFCPTYRCHETLGIPHARDPTPLLSCQMGRKSCSTS